ncbi:MAG: ATP-binding protein [Deltaproteobacteria bacterium]|nr:ATP-binding protein [Deltaproteobacteria bacterium]
MEYLERSLEPAVRKAARDFPAVVLAGPRQSGKTSLLRDLFRETHRYVSLEWPDVRAAATEDPRSFLERHPPPVILDEVQHAPGLMPYVKEKIDECRGKTGQYLLTGYKNLLLAEKVTEFLAGRAAMLRLLPFSYREAARTPQAGFPWEKGADTGRHEFMFRDLWESFLKGGYPEMATNPKRDVARWHASYVQAYLERDLGSLRQVGDLSQFHAFLRALAARSAQLLNITDLARELGLAVNTVKAWISVLESTCQIFILRPYLRSDGKRLVKTPKVYFADVGTLCYLVGLKDAEHAMAGPMGGAIFETAVVGEIVRRLSGRGGRTQLYFWRTSTGVEVDLVVETAGRLIPIEIRMSATPDRSMAKNIVLFRKDFYGRAEKGFVVHPGDAALSLEPDAVALPFAAL